MSKSKTQPQQREKIQTGKPEKRFVDVFAKVEARAEANADSSRIIEGYGAVYETWSNPIWWFKEKIARGAFDSADMSQCIACFNHEQMTIVARFSAGTLELTPDEKGLKFKFEAPNTTAGNDLYENIRLGNITQCSFRFIVEEDSWKYAEDPDKLDERTITKISHVLDVSPVIYPAYEDTSVEARSFEDLEKRKKDYLASLGGDNNVKAECESRDRICQVLALGNNANF